MKDMKAILPLIDKEIRALFQSPIAWIIIGVVLGLMGYSFTLTLFNNRYATLVHIFFQVAGLLLLIVPIITMRLLAEERRAGTLELLLTAPVRESHLVLAKYVAGMSVVLLMIGLTGASSPSAFRFSCGWSTRWRQCCRTASSGCSSACR